MTVLAVVLCLLAGCSGRVSLPEDHLPLPANYRPLQSKDIGARTDATAVPAPTTASAPRPPATVASAGVTLTVAPSMLPGCDPGATATVTIHWRVNAPSVTGVKLEVSESPHSGHKLFAQGGLTGSATTGHWVTRGMQFHLLDAVSGKTLATHVVTQPGCP